MAEKENLTEEGDYGTFKDEETGAGSYTLSNNGGPNSAADPGRRQSMKKTLKSEVKAARESGDQVTACGNICRQICGTIIATIILGLSLAIPIAMIYMGATYLHKCPRERYIPIYILVFGVFLLLKGLGMLIRRIVAHVRKEPEIPCTPTPADGIVGVFLVCWFIAGNVWIIRMYNDYSVDKNSPLFCEPKLYDFVFWLNALFYFLLWAAMILGCCMRSVISCICTCFLSQLDDAINKEEE